MLLKFLFKPKKVEVPVQKPKFDFHTDVKLKWVTVFQTMFALFSLVFLILIHPIPQRGSKYLVIASFAVMWFLIVIKLWKNIFTRIFVVIITTFMVLIFCSNGVIVDNKVVRDCYLDNLISYEGTNYLAGGENRIGIDSSGLVRRPMIMTLFEIGYETKNMRYIRDALDIWLDDYDTKNIYSNYKKLFLDMQKFENLIEIDRSKLEPGDIIIYDDYAQIYIYIGCDQWIQANSVEKKVIRTNVKLPSSIPIELHGKIVRFRTLDKS